MIIRLGRLDDAQAVCDIEELAGSLFVAIGMIADALAGPADLAEVREQIAAERLWVAVDDEDHVLGYIAMTVLDGHAHLAQVSVDPAHSRRGIGRELIEHAVAWARRRGLVAMTLTTYSDVAWNGPYYEQLGFRRLDEAEWTPGLRAIRAAEVAAGLDEWPRVAMTRSL
jgi:GNAT superfamily N-acetyltransferase